MKLAGFANWLTNRAGPLAQHELMGDSKYAQVREASPSAKPQQNTHPKAGRAGRTSQPPGAEGTNEIVKCAHADDDATLTYHLTAKGEGHPTQLTEAGKGGSP